MHADESRALESLVLMQAVHMAQIIHLLLVPGLSGVRAGLHHKSMHQVDIVALSHIAVLLFSHVRVVLVSAAEYHQSDSSHEQDIRLFSATQRVEQHKQHELVREFEQYQQKVSHYQPHLQSESKQHAESVEQFQQ